MTSFTTSTIHVASVQSQLSTPMVMPADASTSISSLGLNLNLSLSLDAPVRAVVGILSITCVLHQHIVRLRICTRQRSLSDERDPSNQGFSLTLWGWGRSWLDGWCWVFVVLSVVCSMVRDMENDLVHRHSLP